MPILRKIGPVKVKNGLFQDRLISFVAQCRPLLSKDIQSLMIMAVERRFEKWIFTGFL